jgi:hypothetical protein
MDSLDNLPVDDKSQLRDEEKDVMDKYLGSNSLNKKNNTYSKWSDISKWKIIGCISVVFLILANPWAQNLFNKFPYFGENKLKGSIISLVIFIILTIIIVMFL